jgi:hypothetical protein
VWKTSRERVLNALIKLYLVGYLRTRWANCRSPSGTSLKSPMTITGRFLRRARENSLSRSLCRRATVFGQDAGEAGPYTQSTLTPWPTGSLSVIPASLPVGLTQAFSPGVRASQMRATPVCPGSDSYLVAVFQARSFVPSSFNGKVSWRVSRVSVTPMMA